MNRPKMNPGAAADSIFRDIRIQEWERAFDQGEIYFTPTARQGPLCDGLLTSASALDKGEGMIINAVIPVCWLPTPLVAIPGKPFSIKMSLADQSTNDDGDGEAVRSKTLKMELAYLTDEQLARINEVVSGATQTKVDSGGMELPPGDKGGAN